MIAKKNLGIALLSVFVLVCLHPLIKPLKNIFLFFQLWFFAKWIEEKLVKNSLCRNANKNLCKNSFHGKHSTNIYKYQQFFCMLSFDVVNFLFFQKKQYRKQNETQNGAIMKTIFLPNETTFLWTLVQSWI